MDHSGRDRELINSPSACWDSRQGELSASSVSGRALGELLQDSSNGAWARGSNRVQNLRQTGRLCLIIYLRQGIVTLYSQPLTYDLLYFLDQVRMGL